MTWSKMHKWGSSIGICFKTTWESLLYFFQLLKCYSDVVLCDKESLLLMVELDIFSKFVHLIQAVFSRLHVLAFCNKISFKAQKQR